MNDNGGNGGNGGDGGGGGNVTTDPGHRSLGQTEGSTGSTSSAATAADQQSASRTRTGLGDPVLRLGVAGLRPQTGP